METNRLLVGVLVTTLAGSLALSSGIPRPPQTDFTNALVLYERGQYIEAVADLTRRGSLDDAFKQFDKTAPGWIAAAPASDRSRRALVAATVALEIARRSPTNEADGTLTRARLIVRGGEVLQFADAGDMRDERLWYLASLAGLETLGAWPIVAGVRGDVPTDDRSILTHWDLAGKAGFLARVLTRFPDEPRFRLAAIEAKELQTIVSGSLRRWKLEEEIPTPEMAEALKARASGQSGPTLGAISGQFAANAVARFAALHDIQQQYAVLARDDSVSAEATLRLGYLHLGTQQWGDGLRELDAVLRLTTDPFLLYLSAVFTGFALEQTDRPDDAVRAYEHALAVVPHAWSASMLLSMRLFVRGNEGDQERAARLMRQLGPAPRSDDPLALYRLGDARLWAAEMLDLREALR